MLIIGFSIYALMYALSLRLMSRSPEMWGGRKIMLHSLLWPWYALITVAIGVLLLYLMFDEAMRRQGI